MRQYFRHSEFDRACREHGVDHRLTKSNAYEFGGKRWTFTVNLL